MAQTGEKSSFSLSRRGRLAVEAVAATAMLAWSLFSPAGGQSDPSSIERAKGAGNSPARNIASLLQSKIRHGKPVPYEANAGVEWVSHSPEGSLTRQTTIVPLEYDPDGNPASGNEQYFRLIGSSLRTIRVQRIPEPIDLVPQQWDPRHPEVTVTSHQGVISTSNVGHVPATTIELSNGHRELVAVGQTSATP